MKRLIGITGIIASVLLLTFSLAEAQMMGGGMMGGSKMEQGMMGSKNSEQKAWLGVFIQNLTPELVRSLGLKDAEGVLVSDVAEGGPADKAGIKREDVIKEINGSEVKEVKDLLNKIGSAAPGQDVSIKVVRGGEETVFKVKLGKAEEEASAGSSGMMGGHGMMGSGMGGRDMDMQGMMGRGMKGGGMMMSPDDMGRMMGEMMQKMMQGMMGRGMAGGGMMKNCPMHKRGLNGRYGRHHRGGNYMDGISGNNRTFLTPDLIERLKLSDEQITKIKKLENNYRKNIIRLNARIKIANLDLRNLLGKDDIDMNDVKNIVSEIESKKTELLLFRIKSLKKFKGILTEEQRKGFDPMDYFE